LVLFALSLLACSTPAKETAPPDEPAKAKPVPKAEPEAEPDPSTAASAAERLRGTWVLNLNDAPDNALSKDFQRFKKSEGLANMVKVEYIVTDTEWIMEKKGAGGVFTKKWHYQILQEIEDTLFLERVSDDGKKERIRVRVGTDELLIGDRGDRVPLRRKKDE
jgi:hypothetical protein